MKKRIISLLLVAFMVATFCSCNGKKAEAPEESATNRALDLQGIKNEMISQLDIKDYVDLDEEKLFDQYGIEGEKVKTNGSFIVFSDVFPAEIIMIEAVDREAAEEIAEKLEGRLQDLKVQSRNYDAESYRIAQNCTVLVNANQVAMFFAQQGPQMEDIYHNNF